MDTGTKKIQTRRQKGENGEKKKEERRQEGIREREKEKIERRSTKKNASGAKNETDGTREWKKERTGARREDWPPTLEHREQGVCFARCFYSGEARCRRTVCPKVGQVSMAVPQSGLCLRACAHYQPMHMQPVGARCCCALLSLNYARRTLFPAPPRFASSTISSTLFSTATVEL